MRTAMVIGNGFTKSLTNNIGFPLDTSKPLTWPVISPGKSSLLIDDLPNLKKFIATTSSNGNDFSIFMSMVNEFINEDNRPIPSLENGEAVLDAGHYLALAFSNFQLQIDQENLLDWDWLDWLNIKGTNLRAVLSWNYDLLIELALARIGRPYHYPNVSTPCEGGEIKWGLPAVTVCKPHGSCNFSSVFNIRNLDESGKPIPPAYPRQISSTAFDSPLKILHRNELLSIRQVADMVLPGEVNRFQRHLHWVSNALLRFSRELTIIDHLVIVGFSMMDCDRDEFVTAIGNNNKFKKITVVDPCPNPLLIKILEKKSTNKIEVITKGLPD
jgi:hypothetical protein